MSKRKRKSDANFLLLENFALFFTHSRKGDSDFKDKMEITPEIMYKAVDNYIEEDHVDGRDSDDDIIVIYKAESSFELEDKEKEFPEQVIIVADYGEEEGTESVLTIDSTDVAGIQKLIDFIANPRPIP